MHYTLRIDKQGVGDFDGSTPLDLDAAGVTLDATQPGRITVTVPDGINLGSIDPGQVLERAGASAQHTYVLSQISLGGPRFDPGDVIRRRVPGATVTETLEDLEATDGQPSSNRYIFMPNHTLEILTSAGGPFSLSMLLKPIADSDLVGASVE